MHGLAIIAGLLIALAAGAWAAIYYVTRQPKPVSRTLTPRNALRGPDVAAELERLREYRQNQAADMDWDASYPQPAETECAAMTAPDDAVMTEPDSHVAEMPWVHVRDRYPHGIHDRDLIHVEQSPTGTWHPIVLSEPPQEDSQALVTWQAMQRDHGAPPKDAPQWEIDTKAWQTITPSRAALAAATKQMAAERDDLVLSLPPAKRARNAITSGGKRKGGGRR